MSAEEPTCCADRACNPPAQRLISSWPPRSHVELPPSSSPRPGAVGDRSTWALRRSPAACADPDPLHRVVRPRRGCERRADTSREPDATAGSRHRSERAKHRLPRSPRACPRAGDGPYVGATAERRVQVSLVPLAADAVTDHGRLAGNSAQRMLIRWRRPQASGRCPSRATTSMSLIGTHLPSRPLRRFAPVSLLAAAHACELKQRTPETA